MVGYVKNTLSELDHDWYLWRGIAMVLAPRSLGEPGINIFRAQQLRHAIMIWTTPLQQVSVSGR